VSSFLGFRSGIAGRSAVKSMDRVPARGLPAGAFAAPPVRRCFDPAFAPFRVPAVQGGNLLPDSVS